MDWSHCSLVYLPVSKPVENKMQDNKSQVMDWNIMKLFCLGQNQNPNEVFGPKQNTKFTKTSPTTFLLVKYVVSI